MASLKIDVSIGFNVECDQCKMEMKGVKGNFKCPQCGFSISISFPHQQVQASKFDPKTFKRPPPIA